MNQVQLIGRLTKDPDTRYSDELCIAKYTLAVNRRKAGEADFIPCVTFGRSAEFADKYFHKGMLVGVTGRIQTGKYTNKDGNTVFTMEVAVDNQEFCEKKEQPAPDKGWMEVPENVQEELPFV